MDLQPFIYLVYCYFSPKKGTSTFLMISCRHILKAVHTSAMKRSEYGNRGGYFEALLLSSMKIRVYDKCIEFNVSFRKGTVLIP